MQELVWLDHIGTLEEGVQLANRLCWNLTVVERSGRWAVLGGDQVIFAADNREAVDAFLYGMGLASSVVPDSLAEQLRKDLDL